MDKEKRYKIITDFQNAVALSAIAGLFFIFVKDELKNYISFLPEGIIVGIYLIGLVLLYLLINPTIYPIVRGILFLWSESKLGFLSKWSEKQLLSDKESEDLTGGFTFYLAAIYLSIAIGFILAELLFIINSFLKFQVDTNTIALLPFLFPIFLAYVILLTKPAK